MPGLTTPTETSFSSENLCGISNSTMPWGRDMKSDRFLGYLDTKGSVRAAGAVRVAILACATLSLAAFAGCNDLPAGWQCMDSAEDCEPGYYVHISSGRYATLRQDLLGGRFVDLSRRSGL